MNAPPLKLQNCFEELSNLDNSETVATGSTCVTTIEGASSIKKRGVRATLNCYLWTCTRAVPKIQVKASWAHTKMKTRLKEWMSANSL